MLDGVSRVGGRVLRGAGASGPRRAARPRCGRGWRPTGRRGALARHRRIDAARTAPERQLGGPAARARARDVPRRHAAARGRDRELPARARCGHRIGHVPLRHVQRGCAAHGCRGGRGRGPWHRTRGQPRRAAGGRLRGMGARGSARGPCRAGALRCSRTTRVGHARPEHERAPGRGSRGAPFQCQACGHPEPVARIQLDPRVRRGIHRGVHRSGLGGGHRLFVQGARAASAVGGRFGRRRRAADAPIPSP